MPTEPAAQNPKIAFAWLSVATALLTMGLKGFAYSLTGSVGLLSDALESGVNLAAALLAVAVVRISSRPPDDRYPFGHEKVEYFSSGFEGALIMVAAGGIVWTALPRLYHPHALEAIGLGLGLSTLASALNGAVAMILFRAGRKHSSIALEADAHHLMTDVWTSLSVLAGVGLAVLTGYTILDPISALLAAAYIAWVGARLVWTALHSMLDPAIDPTHLARIDEILAIYGPRGVAFHALRTRRAGHSNFVQMHVLVPGDWTVARGHQLLEEIEQAISGAVPSARILTHLEAIEEPASFEDIELDRSEPRLDTSPVSP